LFCPTPLHTHTSAADFSLATSAPGDRHPVVDLVEGRSGPSMRLTEAGIRSAATVANRCSCEASLSRRLSETLNDWPVGADDGIPLSLTLSI